MNNEATKQYTSSEIEGTARLMRLAAEFRNLHLMFSQLLSRARELEEQIKAYRLVLDDGVNAEKEIYFVPGYGWEADLGGTNMGYCDTLPDALARLSGK